MKIGIDQFMNLLIKYVKILKIIFCSQIFIFEIFKKADLSSPLTITSQREKLIDFTKPIMSLGIGVLYKRDKLKSIDLFAFLSPFCWDTWICLIGIYLCK